MYTKITQMICDPFGKKFTWDLKVKMMGKKEIEAGKIFVGMSVVKIRIN